MFRRTSPNQPLFGAETGLPESSRGRLKNSWAYPFRVKVLPLLMRKEEYFADLYSDGSGRPNWSVARNIALLYLQETFDLADKEALDCLAFDCRWQYALGLEPRDAYLSRRSHVEFRSRLVGVDPEMTRLRSLFEVIRDAMIADLGVSISKQRLDSTHLVSNIKTRGRVDLFGKTLMHFLRGLEQVWPDRMVRLSAGLLKWFEEKRKNSWFGPGPDKKKAEKLARLATWLYEVREVFAEDREVCNSDRYQLVERVLEEHCEITFSRSDDDTPGAVTQDSQVREETSDCAVTVKPGNRIQDPGGTLQSPFDPDAARGHKGTGYSGFVTETCGNEGPEVLTDYDVLPAGPDQDKSGAVVDRLVESGCKPEVLFADTGFGTGQSIVDAQADGVRLHAPVARGNGRKDRIGRDQFTYDDNTGEVLRCPAGHAPARHGLRRSENDRGTKRLHAYFDGATCRRCPLMSRCCVKPKSQGRKGQFSLEITQKLVEHDRRLAEQEDAPFRDPYSIRAGIEATVSELKRAHGLGQLRVRRRVRVRLAVALKVTACNLKRWIRASIVQQRLVATARHVRWAVESGVFALRAPQAALDGLIGEMSASPT